MPLGNSGIGPGLDGSDPARQLQEYVRRGASFSGNEAHVVFNNEKGSFKNVAPTWSSPDPFVLPWVEDPSDPYAGLVIVNRSCDIYILLVF